MKRKGFLITVIAALAVFVLGGCAGSTSAEEKSESAEVVSEETLAEAAEEATVSESQEPVATETPEEPEEEQAVVPTFEKIDILNLIGYEENQWTTFMDTADSIICNRNDINNDSGVRRANITVYDYEGNIYNSYVFDIDYDSAWGTLIVEQLSPDDKLGFQYTNTKMNGDISINLYDTHGVELAALTYNYPSDYVNGYVSLTKSSNPRYLIEVINSVQTKKSTGEIVCFLDTETWTLVDKNDPSVSGITEVFPTEYDETVFSFFEDNFPKDVGRRLVSNADGSEWGYVDDNLNIISMYRDATGFNMFGYALASKEGNSYDLINSDLEVVIPDCFSGDGASLLSGCGPIFCIRNGEDREFYKMNIE